MTLDNIFLAISVPQRQEEALLKICEGLRLGETYH
jgi:hypothetical protein